MMRKAVQFGIQFVELSWKLNQNEQIYDIVKKLIIVAFQEL